MHTSSPLTCVGHILRNGHTKLTPNPCNLQGGILATQAGTLEPVAMSATMNTHTASRDSYFGRQNTEMLQIFISPLKLLIEG